MIVKETTQAQSGWIVYVTDAAEAITNAALSDVVGASVTERQRQEMVDGFRVWVSGEPEMSGDIPPDPNVAIDDETESPEKGTDTAR